MKLEITGSYTDVDLGTVYCVKVLDGQLFRGMLLKGAEVKAVYKFGRSTESLKEGNEGSMTTASEAGYKVGDVLEG